MEISWDKLFYMARMQDGDYDKESDIDVMILVDMSDLEIKKYFNDICNLAFELELENDIIISPFIKDINQFNHWLPAMPFYQNVRNEGVILNG